MRRLFLICISFLLGGCRADQVPQTGRVSVDVCYSSATAPQIVPLYAFEKGIYANYGLDVHLVQIEGGSTATTALIAGSAQLCQVAGSAVVNSVVAGSDLVLVAGLVNTNLFSLFVTPDITSAANLKKKAVGVSTPGSSSDTSMRAILRSFHLEPDEDVAILSLGGSSTRLAAMKSGVLAGAVFPFPESIQAHRFGYRELVNMADLHIPYQLTALATSRRFIRENPETVKRFLRGTIDAIARMKHDREGSIDVISTYLLLDKEKDAAVLAETYDIVIQRYLADAPYPTAEGIQMDLDALAMDNPAAANYKAADVIDTTLLEEIEAGGRPKNPQP